LINSLLGSGDEMLFSLSLPFWSHGLLMRMGSILVKIVVGFWVAMMGFDI
jgi:hypothetical protein